MATNFSCVNQNLSRTSLTEDAWILDQEGVVNETVLCVVLVIIAIVGFPLNAVVLVVLTFKKFWRTPSTYLLFNLSLVDFLSCLITISFVIPPLSASAYNYGSNDYDRCLLCQAGAVLMIWPIVISLHIMPVISLDRIIYVNKPLQYEKWVTVPRLAIVLFAIWVICLLLVIPPYFGFGETGYRKAIGVCTLLLKSHLELLLFVELMVPFSVLFLTNIWLIFVACRGIRSRFEKIYQNIDDPRMSEVKRLAKKKYVSQQLQILKVFGLIFAIHFISTIPLSGFVVGHFIIGTSHEPSALSVIVLCVFLANSAIHPILESFLSTKVRMLAKKAFKSCPTPCSNVTISDHGSKH